MVSFTCSKPSGGSPFPLRVETSILKIGRLIHTQSPVSSLNVFFSFSSRHSHSLSSKTPSILVPQTLCTWCPLCLNYFSLRYMCSSLLNILQIHSSNTDQGLPRVCTYQYSVSPLLYIVLQHLPGLTFTTHLFFILIFFFLYWNLCSTRVKIFMFRLLNSQFVGQALPHIKHLANIECSKYY